MAFLIGQTVAQSNTLLNELLQGSSTLEIRDTQDARITTNILEQLQPENTTITPWQVYAAETIHKILSGFMHDQVDREALAIQPDLQKKVEELQSNLTESLDITDIALYLIMTFIFHQDHALHFILPLFEGIPTVNETEIRSILPGIFQSSTSTKPAWESICSIWQEHPQDLLAQMHAIQHNWHFLSHEDRLDMDKAIKFIYEEIEEEQKRAHAPERVLQFKEQQSTSRIQNEVQWKKDLVLIAKNANVWLVQLSKKYGQEIQQLNDIPDAELQQLAAWGINALWLIGVWERSPASKRIKELYGRTDTTASAYSIKSYRIAPQLGGDEAAEAFMQRCERLGIKLCVDIVPNHTGIDSDWILEHPDWYISVPNPPINEFHYASPDLSPTHHKTIMLEDGYYNQTGAAEVFLYRDNEKEAIRFIYHGNDGTSMPWNDTAQLNYLNPQVREHMIQTILRIVQKFPLIRFDAAMTLAKKHFQRLWFPLPDSKERCIPTREGNTMNAAEFDRRMPQEFWREVVERVSSEAPQAVLMAEAFWLMEGYFINELGMHRVYNSAFMNLLRDEENDKYKQILQNALKSNPEILGKFVNFLNNPDERTAVDQFGKSDKYFAICTLLATMPGLPMLGHGQFEGYEERYGMDFLAPKWDEKVDQQLIKDHERWLVPLLRQRSYFSDANAFHLFHVVNNSGEELQDVFAYLTEHDGVQHMVLVNNSLHPKKCRLGKTYLKANQDEQEYASTLFKLLSGKVDAVNTQWEEIRSEVEWEFSAKEIQNNEISFALKPYQHLVFRIT